MAKSTDFANMIKAKNLANLPTELNIFIQPIQLGGANVPENTLL